MSRLALLRTSDYRRVRWKNDGGWTTEIAREPADLAMDLNVLSELGVDWHKFGSTLKFNTSVTAATP